MNKNTNLYVALSAVRLTISAAVCWATLGSSNANAALIDFSNYEIPGSYFGTMDFVSSGFHFRDTYPYGPGSYQSVIDSATESDPNLQHPAPGTMWAVGMFPDVTGEFFIDGGRVFTLNSMDVNWFDNYYSSTDHQWSVTGIFADGTTQTVSGTLSANTFAAEVLNWQNLQIVTFTGHADNYGFMGLNNIDVTVGAAVPEPATGALMMAGFGCVAGLRRHLRRKVIAV